MKSASPSKCLSRFKPPLAIEQRRFTMMEGDGGPEMALQLIVTLHEQGNASDREFELMLFDLDEKYPGCVDQLIGDALKEASSTAAS
jgi:hypothetical protein